MGAEAPINKIIDFSAVDGMGCRMAVFVQGCNMFCDYCHNPETRRICKACGKCAARCKTGALTFDSGRITFDRSLCAECDECISLCENSASPRVELMSAEQVIARAKTLQPFIRGITVSGGECTLYPEFLGELAYEGAKVKLGVLIDTNGLVDITHYEHIISNIEGVLLDIKPYYMEALDAELENAARLAEAGKLTEIRLVVFSFGAEAAKYAIKRLACLVPCDIPLRLSAFRPYGVHGYMKNSSSPAQIEMEDVVLFALNEGFINAYMQEHK